MGRIMFLQGLLQNFKGLTHPRGRRYIPKETAYEYLKKHTGQDFGEDFDAWEQWIRDHPRSILVKDRPNDTKHGDEKLDAIQRRNRSKE